MTATLNFYAASADELGLQFPRKGVALATITATEVHHSVYPASMTPRQQIAEIQNLHLGKGWNGVFYNDFLDIQTGDLYPGRPFRSTSQAPNARTLCLLGDMRTDRASERAVATVYRYAKVFGGVGNIRGHQERPYATACPGPNGMTIVDLIRGGWEPGDPLPDSVIVDKPILEPGDRNFVVGGLQIHLQNLGMYDGGDEPAYYGKRTTAAVRRFQGAYQLPITGEWSRREQNVLTSVLAFLDTVPAAEPAAETYAPPPRPTADAVGAPAPPIAAPAPSTSGSLTSGPVVLQTAPTPAPPPNEATPQPDEFEEALTEAIDPTDMPPRGTPPAEIELDKKTPKGKTSTLAQDDPSALGTIWGLITALIAGLAGILANTKLQIGPDALGAVLALAGPLVQNAVTRHTAISPKHFDELIDNLGNIINTGQDLGELDRQFKV